MAKVSFHGIIRRDINFINRSAKIVL